MSVMVEVRCGATRGRDRPCRELMATYEIGPDGLPFGGLKPADGQTGTKSRWGDDSEGGGWSLTVVCPRHGFTHVSEQDVMEAARAGKRRGKAVLYTVLPLRRQRRRPDR